MVFSNKDKDKYKEAPVITSGLLNTPVHDGPILQGKRLELAGKKGELFRVQKEVEQIVADIAWLELNPMAESIFKRLLTQAQEGRAKVEEFMGKAKLL